MRAWASGVINADLKRSNRRRQASRSDKTLSDSGQWLCEWRSEKLAKGQLSSKTYFLVGRLPSLSGDEINSTRTRASPDLVIPRTVAAARETSMIRPLWYGPRSLIRRSTDFPFSKLVTFTMLPNGRWRCAAVKFVWLKISPLAVRLP